MEEKFKFHLMILIIKTDFVSHPDCGEGNYILSVSRDFLNWMRNLILFKS